jgi:hypothetical protein
MEGYYLRQEDWSTRNLDAYRFERSGELRLFPQMGKRIPYRRARRGTALNSKCQSVLFEIRLRRAISILRDQRACYNESFEGFAFTNSMAQRSQFDMHSLKDRHRVAATE